MTMQFDITSRDSFRAEHEARRERLTREWPHPGLDDRAVGRQQHGVRYGLRYLAPVMAQLTGRRHHRHA